MNLQNFSLRYVRLACSQDLEGYILRQQQPLPSTPRISINSQNQQIISVYVQNLRDSFLHSEWDSFSTDAIFQYLLTTIIANMGLKKKFGCFMINQTLIKLSSNNSLRAWINQDPVLNYRQFPLPFERGSETLMVESIIKLFKPLIPELEEIFRSETLQGFLSEVRVLKKSHKSFSKAINKVEGNFSQRKGIKSFFDISKPKPILSKFSQLNSSVDGSGNPKTYLSNLSKQHSPKNLSFSQKKHDTMFKCLKTSFSKRHNPLTFEPKKRLVSFSYSSPISMNNSILQQGMNEFHFIDSILERTTKPVTQPYRPPKRESIIAQDNIADMEEKEKLFAPPKFPHSIQSTFGTLKETKSFSDMHYEVLESIAIEEELRNKANLRNSSKGLKGSFEQKYRKVSCNEFSNTVGNRKQLFTQEIKPPIVVVEQPGQSGDIEDQFDNLFFGDKESDNSKEEEEFTQRELEFEDILFS